MGYDKTPGDGTLTVWAGEEETFWEHATQVPVVHSVSFGYDDMDKWLEIGQGKAPGHIYSRNTNPTVRAFEDKIRRLEGAASATSFETRAVTRQSFLSSSMVRKIDRQFH